ncbi:MAG: 4Fe-4S single cluster domain-containing protein, partial [Acidimicrobiales bacterium]
MTSLLRLSRMHYPVTVLGFGQRIGIWFQGCSIGCRGCISKDTWPADEGFAVTVDEVLDRCEAWAAAGALDGITISGGEPFEQPAGLLALLDGLTAWLGPRRESVDIMCYSGYPERRLLEAFPEIVQRLDVLVPNPFVQARAPGGRWQGSNNQRLAVLTPLGESRYGGAPSTPATPEIQFVVDDGIWLIGVPRPGDM